MHQKFDRTASPLAAVEVWPSKANRAAPDAVRIDLACGTTPLRGWDVARCAAAVRNVLGHRLTVAQARTISIMESYCAAPAACRVTGNVVAFRKREGR